jgi:heterodisulfide reductase subunit A
MLSLTPNSWGFFNTDQAVLSEDVIIAGCAKGPKDILSSRQEGRIAAARVMEDLDLKPGKKTNVAVFGEGSQADRTAQAVSQKGYPTYIFGPGAHLPKSSSVNIVNTGKLISLEGTAGNFSLLYATEGNKKETLTCGAVICAQEPALSFNRPAGTSNKLMDPYALSDLLKKDSDRCPDNIVILLDYSGPEFKSWARAALDTAITAKSLNKNVSVIMNKMLVHGALGQRRYDTARQKGIDFFRFDAPEDVDIQDAGQGFSIKLKEATLPSMVLDISCDCLIIPPALTPAHGFEHTAALLKQHLDFQGFLQSANTRHRLTRSPRRGIFFAGTCHDETDLDDLDIEIKDILAALPSRSPDLPPMDPGVEINQKKCAQCLTCIRICPHSAIVMNEKHRPQIVPDACFSCHLCVANCPAYAIESTALSNDQIAQKIQKDRIAVLACERSAALAAGNLALPDFVDLIPIPCACRISPDVILKALLNGASKVIVSGCHQENCRSVDGTGAARDSVKKVLSIPELDPAKVLWEPVAANETVKFERIISNATE